MKKFVLSRFALTVPVVCLAVAASAVPLDRQSMKEGFWTTHVVTTSKPSGKVTDGHYSVCHSHAFDEWSEAREKRPGCTISQDSWSGNTRTVSMSCDMHGTTISNKSTTVMVSDSSVHNESHVTYTPAFMGMTEEIATMDFTYAGPCPAGVQPGDRVNENGSVMHLWRH